MILGKDVLKNSDAAIAAFQLDNPEGLYSLPKTNNALRGMMMVALPGDSVVLKRGELFLSMFKTETESACKFPSTLKGDPLTAARDQMVQQKMTILEDDLFRLLVAQVDQSHLAQALLLPNGTQLSSLHDKAGSVAFAMLYAYFFPLSRGGEAERLGNAVVRINNGMAYGSLSLHAALQVASTTCTSIGPNNKISVTRLLCLIIAMTMARSQHPGWHQIAIDAIEDDDSEVTETNADGIETTTVHTGCSMMKLVSIVHDKLKDGSASRPLDKSTYALAAAASSTAGQTVAQ